MLPRPTLSRFRRIALLFLGSAFTFAQSPLSVRGRTNYTGYIGNLSSPLFGHPTGAGSARQLQFEVGYTF